MHLRRSGLPECAPLRFSGRAIGVAPAGDGMRWPRPHQRCSNLALWITHLSAKEARDEDEKRLREAEAEVNPRH
jgi:hypothetical protein